MKPNAKLIGYCRVSTNNQKNEGTIEIQERALTKYTHKYGYRMFQTIKDNGVSGSLEDRPGLLVLFDALESDPEIEGVLIYKLDRLARDLYIQEHLIKKIEGLGKRLISINEPDLDSTDPMRKAFRQFSGIVSELEKSFITMRLKEGRLKKARRKGFAGGGVPLGYKAKNKDLVIDENAKETVRKIHRMKRGRKSLYAIAKALNASGASTARGGKWYPATVKYILNNCKYRGKISYSGTVCDRPEIRLIA